MAVRFDTGGEAIQRSANVPTSTAYTCCGWGRIVTDNNAISIIANLEAAAVADILAFAADSDGTTLSIFWDGGTEFANVLAVTVGQDFFWALTSSGNAAGDKIGYARLSSSNALTSAASGTAADGFTSANMSFGCATSSALPFNGRVWNIKCWDRVLTAAELLVESYYRRVMYPSSLNFHWPLDRHTDLNDYGGNGRAGTAVGTLSTEDVGLGLWRNRRRVFVPAAAASTGGPLVGGSLVNGMLLGRGLVSYA